MTDYNLNELMARYERMTARAVAECHFTTSLVGGQPGGEQGVRLYVAHHLKLEGEKAEQAVKRILTEEVGEREITPPAGEIVEAKVYGINIIRRDGYGPWLGDWMVKAMLKQAASRLGIFVTKRGTKGDMAEMGRARATGISALDDEHLERIYLRSADGQSPADTHFERFTGRVQTPQGAKSIVTDAECAPAGTRFAFEYRFIGTRLSEEQAADIFAAAMQIGLGSAKAFERGKFAITKLSYELAGQSITA